jgi:beta-lactamase class A
MTATIDQIAAIFADAGCRGWLRAQVVGKPASVVDFGGTEPVVAASVYKLVVMVAAARAFDRGQLDPQQAIRVVPRECTPGPTGLCTFSDPVTMSWRDIVRSMMTVSDNAAADVVLSAVGLGAIDDVISDLGLTNTRVIGGTAAVHEQIVHDTGRLTLDEAVALLASNNTVRQTAAFDPAYTTATSAADTNRVLECIWTNTAASREQCALMRTILGQQIWPHRIRSAFPYDDVTVAGKTGTIGPIRNEAAVVVFPHETPIAVSVFTRSARADLFLPVVDRAIGLAARVGVTELRSGI